MKNQRLTKRRKLTREDKKLAKKIRGLRIKQGLTQEKLSGLLGANLSYIAYIETHRRGFSLPMLYKVAKVLGVPVAKLFEDKSANG